MSATVTDPVAPAVAVAADDETPVRPVGEARRRRFVPEMPHDRVTSWVWALAVTALAGLVRFTNLTHPKGMIFDEVYYRKDAWALLHHGYELNPAGDGPGFVAHPPLGKWCIAVGQWLFGNTEFGWRFSAALVGSLAVLLLVRIGRRLFRSTLLGCLAGLLLALDGLAVVQSRVALLDVFLMFFVLAAFGCLLLDRDARRRQVLRDVEEGLVTPRHFPRRRRGDLPWWRLAAGVMLGCALGVKWSAVWYVIGFALLILAWEVGVRRSAGVRHRFLETQREFGWVAAFGLTALLTYLATWTGWLATDGGWDRHWAQSSGTHYPFVPDALVSLLHYHSAVLNFHTHLSSHHDYQSSPWSWLVLGRPVAFAYSSPGGCGAAQCSSETLALGTPTLWWAFIPALLAVAFFWIARRDWRAATILVTATAGLLPWFAFPSRTMFFFYTLPALPFLVLAVTYVLGVVLGSATASPQRRLTGAIIVAAYVVVVAATFAFFYPIYTSELLTYAQWHARMWLGTWI
ncbi:MAG TPA: phospholipid carrier-dependent glycosyltransferase [Mycobacteriales bacterium]|nr:phospholipid carrier-dependent glycosyltransferase [Mycobacteriales bacterium]